jgi:hypothetical protein
LSKDGGLLRDEGGEDESKPSDMMGGLSYLASKVAARYVQSIEYINIKLK